MADTLDHPAKFSQPIMRSLAALLDDESVRLDGRQLRVLDPFAGVGRVHELATELQHLTVGVELEREWAAAGGSLCADATRLPFSSASFDVVATSPCYGNRMADTYDGSRDRCTDCAGSGVDSDEGNPCETCDGTSYAPSRRSTYRISLGHELTSGSAAGLQWGEAYRELHRAAWGEARRVLRPGGLLVVNVSNHVRGGRVPRVVEWHLSTLLALGLYLVHVETIGTARMRYGANYGARVEHEHVLVLRRSPWADPTGTRELWSSE